MKAPCEKESLVSSLLFSAAKGPNNRAASYITSPTCLIRFSGIPSRIKWAVAVGVGLKEDLQHDPSKHGYVLQAFLRLKDRRPPQYERQECSV